MFEDSSESFITLLQSMWNFKTLKKQNFSQNLNLVNVKQIHKNEDFF